MHDDWSNENNSKTLSIILGAILGPLFLFIITRMVYFIWRIYCRNNCFFYRRKKCQVSIVFAIIVTSFATYISRFFGVVSSEKINENSKIYRWFNCLAYSTLAALISRTIFSCMGILSETDI